MEKQIYTFPLNFFYKDVFGIITTRSGTYVCPGWHPVPVETTRDQITFDYSTIAKESVTSLEVTVSLKPQLWLVAGSKPGSKYEVMFNGKVWSCSCPANHFRRGDCKHVMAKKDEAEKILA